LCQQALQRLDIRPLKGDRTENQGRRAGHYERNGQPE
jgi:hypothetical protein